jgi:amidase
MAVSQPSEADIDAAARHFGFHLDADARRDYTAVVAATLMSYDVVDRLYDKVARPQPPDRAYRFPEPADNPLGPWYVTT